jgi:hypothetical protein
VTLSPCDDILKRKETHILHHFPVVALIAYRLSGFPVQFIEAADLTQIPELVTQYFGPDLNSETKEAIRHIVRYENQTALTSVYQRRWACHRNYWCEAIQTDLGLKLDFYGKILVSNYLTYDMHYNF